MNITTTESSNSTRSVNKHSVWIKSLFLIGVIVTIIFLLMFFYKSIFKDKTGITDNLSIKNVLIELIDMTENALVQQNMKLEKEKQALLEMLKTIVDKSKRKEIEERIKLIEAEIDKNKDQLVATKKERAAIESEILRKKSDLQRIMSEKEKLENEVVDLQFYIESYVESLKDIAFLSDDKSIVEEAFKSDKGISYLKDKIVSEKENREKVEILEDQIEIVKSNMDVVVESIIKDKALLSKIKAKKGDASYADELKAVILETLESSQTVLVDDPENSREIKELIRKKDNLENVIAKKDKEIIKYIDNINREKTEKDCLFNVSGINGFFVNIGGELFMIINSDKKNEIIQRKVFTVYDKDQNETTKIVISEENGDLTYQTFAGSKYSDPVSGNWF